MFKRPFTALTNRMQNFFSPKKSIKEENKPYSIKVKEDETISPSRRRQAKRMDRYSGRRKYTPAPAIH